jgi:hypothetical protein
MASPQCPAPTTTVVVVSMVDSYGVSTGQTTSTVTWVGLARMS